MSNYSIANLKLLLFKSKQNIEEIRRLSALSGISYCCIGALENRQKELEDALNLKRPNLGLIPLIVGGALALTAIGSAIWWHYRTTEVEKERYECIKQALDTGLDPNEYCGSGTGDSITQIIKGVAVIAVLAMIVMLVMNVKK